LSLYLSLRLLPSFPTRRSSALFSPASHDRLIFFSSGCTTIGNSASDASKTSSRRILACHTHRVHLAAPVVRLWLGLAPMVSPQRSEEHTSELQSRFDLVCRLLL